MPREWHDRHSVNMIQDQDKKNFYRDIVADRKPYFMRYIYPTLMKQYNTYIKNTDRSAMREFGMTVSEMENMPVSSLTERQIDFLRYFRIRLPVGTGDCVMNKICRRFESEFDGFVGRANKEISFDYNIMKSGQEYAQSQYYAIKKVYNDYNNKLKQYSVYAYYERIDESEAASAMSSMRDEFVRECYNLCSNSKTLCDIILDICYRKTSSKKFAWDICGDTIINNLLSINDNVIRIPVARDNGTIEFRGETFEEISTTLTEE